MCRPTWNGMCATCAMSGTDPLPDISTRLALRSAQLLNLSELARDVGVAVTRPKTGYLSGSLLSGLYPAALICEPRQAAGEIGPRCILPAHRRRTVYLGRPARRRARGFRSDGRGESLRTWWLLNSSRPLCIAVRSRLLFLAYCLRKRGRPGDRRPGRACSNRESSCRPRHARMAKGISDSKRGFGDRAGQRVRCALRQDPLCR